MDCGDRCLDTSVTGHGVGVVYVAEGEEDTVTLLMVQATVATRMCPTSAVEEELQVRETRSRRAAGCADASLGKGM